MSDILELEKQADDLREKGQYEEAIAKLQEVLAIDEKFVRAHLGLSVLYHLTKDYPKSVEHGEKAVEIEPQDPFNHAALSITYQRAIAGTQDPIYIEKAEAARDRSNMML